MAILMIILFPVGLLMIFKPAIIWEISESWKSTDATEPSDSYIWSVRVRGIIVVLAAVAVFIMSMLD